MSPPAGAADDISFQHSDPVGRRDGTSIGARDSQRERVLRVRLGPGNLYAASFTESKSPTRLTGVAGRNNGTGVLNLRIAYDPIQSMTTVCLGSGLSAGADDSATLDPIDVDLPLGGIAFREPHVLHAHRTVSGDTYITVIPIYR